MKLASRLRRLEATARLTEKFSVDDRRPALMASVMAKLDRVLAGEVLPPADWTNTPLDVVAHRQKLLSRLESNK